MKNIILIAILTGLVVALLANALFIMIPALQNIIPNNLRSMVIGGIAGGTAVLAVAKFNKSKPG